MKRVIKIASNLICCFIPGRKRRASVRNYIRDLHNITHEDKRLIKTSLSAVCIKSIRTFPSKNKVFLVNNDFIVKFVTRDFIIGNTIASKILCENFDKIKFPEVTALCGDVGYYYPKITGERILNYDGNQTLQELADFIAGLHSLDVDIISPKMQKVLMLRKDFILNGRPYWRVFENQDKLSEIFCTDVSEDIKNIKKTFSAHRLDKPIFMHGDLNYINLLQNIMGGGISAVIDLDTFCINDNPLLELPNILPSLQTITEMFNFIELLNMAYKAHGVKIRISESDSICIIKFSLFRVALEHKLGLRCWCPNRIKTFLFELKNSQSYGSKAA
jgi:hypothetical protein